MNKYRRLTQADRYQIEALVNSRISIREISRMLGFNPSTISREVARNCDREKSIYIAVNADLQSKKRRSSLKTMKKISGTLEKEVRVLLLLDWSPEQICGRLKLESSHRLSHETIYKYIYEDYKNGGALWSHARRRRRWRKTHVASRNFKRIGARIDRSWMDERPVEANERTRLGDFERDTVLGKKGGGGLLTIVDRRSRLSRIRYLPKVTGKIAHEATVEALKDLNARTITNDNGHEFCDHKNTATVLNVEIYFCKPYRSYERGTNENTNGLIRQYFPKGEHPDPNQIPLAEDRLNNRPRKCLGFKTPNEVHNILSGVALSG